MIESARLAAPIMRSVRCSIEPLEISHMPSINYIEIVNKGAVLWNQWREKNIGIKPNTTVVIKPGS
jgi:hypothetical protein